MQSRVNISIDDISPHPRSSTGVLDRCFEVIEEFPEAKFTLFIPMSYWRTIKPGTQTEKPFQLDMFPDFCKKIRELPVENFEIGFHGFHHGIPGVSDNDEMKSLSEDNAKKLFSAMFDICKKADLFDRFSPILRPPAWRMSPDCFKVAEEFGIEILALSPKQYAIDTYGGSEKSFRKVVYYNVNPPFEDLKLYPSTEIVYHACECDKNYLSKDLTSELIQFLKKNINSIRFSFMDEM